MILCSTRIPVATGQQGRFEQSFAGRPKLFGMSRGFIRNELLRPIQGDHYLLLTYWETRENLDAWTRSAGYRDVISEMKDPGLLSGPVQQTVHEVISIQERVLR